MSHAIARHRYTATDPRPYLQFLADCVAECDRRHTPEEVAQADALLSRAINVPQFDLLLGPSK